MFSLGFYEKKSIVLSSFVVKHLQCSNSSQRLCPMNSLNNKEKLFLLLFLLFSKFDPIWENYLTGKKLLSEIREKFGIKGRVLYQLFSHFFVRGGSKTLFWLWITIWLISNCTTFGDVCQTFVWSNSLQQCDKGSVIEGMMRMNNIPIYIS